MGDIGPGGYRKLLAWQKSHLLATTTYKTTRALKREDYWVQQQICRAAFSVPSNIVEGYARRSRKAYLHALDIAMASLAEVEYQLLFMREVHLIDQVTHERMDRLTSETGFLLHRLIRSLSNSGGSAGQPLGEEPANYRSQGDSDWSSDRDDEILDSMVAGAEADPSDPSDPESCDPSYPSDPSDPTFPLREVP